MKRLLCIINYYYPYVSGVSEYARLSCEGLAQKGWEVTVLTSNYDKLPKKEMINGVKVVRASIICKISKGVVSAEFIRLAKRMSKEADAVCMHLPMMEAGILVSLIDVRKLSVIYHCDVNLPPTLINKFIISFMHFSHKRCLKKCKNIGATSLDYAIHSEEVAKFKNKIVELGAPIKNYEPSIKSYQSSDDIKIIGFCGRIVAEKGIKVLLKAFLELQKKYDNLQLLIGGDYKNVAGGSIYEELADFIQREKIKNVEFIGKIPEERMAEFYSSLDVFVLPSIYKLEAFGMVQIEAMLCGTPVVASDLYGVRTIVGKTGMGEISEKGNFRDLAEKISRVLNNRNQYVKPRDEILELYGYDKFIEVCDKMMQ